MIVCDIIDVYTHSNSTNPLEAVIFERRTAIVIKQKIEGHHVAEESRAVARKPRDAAAVLFGLKFADNIHYKFIREPTIYKSCQRYINFA